MSHKSWLAADFEIHGIPNKQVAAWIQNYLDFDQLILEFYNPKYANSGWIHCSYVDSNRKQALIYDGVRFSTFA